MILRMMERKMEWLDHLQVYMEGLGSRKRCRSSSTILPHPEIFSKSPKTRILENNVNNPSIGI